MQPAPSRTDSSIESLLLEAADAFTDALNAGSRPSIDEYAQTYPEIATIIRQVFPALAVLEPTPLDTQGDPTQTRERLGDFKIVREIGRGGMGIVYEAEQLSLGRTVALKVLPFAGLLDDKQLQRFKNEARAAATLSHPNIVPVYSVGSDRSVHFYAMQLVRGASLAEVIAKLREATGVRRQDTEVSPSTTGFQPVPAWKGQQPEVSSQPEAAPHSSRQQLTANSQQPAQSEIRNLKSEIETQAIAALSTEYSTNPKHYFRRVAELGIQAASALQHAHDRGVIHRDIKPANILLDTEGKAWITDFGLARIGRDAGMTLTGDLLGTLRYMAPEQALGKRVILDHRTDVYSLGATLYEMLALQPLFPDTDREELLNQIAFETPRPLRRIHRSIPAELETIVHKSIEKNPDDRYATAQDLADDLQRFAEMRPIQARPPSWAKRFSKWLHRHKAVCASLATSLVVVLATLIAVSMWISAAENRRLEERLSLEQARAQSYQAAFRSLSYALDVSEAAKLSEANTDVQYGAARELLDRHIPADGEPDLRGFEWYLYDHITRAGDRGLKQKWKAHDKQIYYVAYSPDGRQLATASEDRTVKIWESDTGRLLQTLYGHESDANCVAFSPDSKYVAAAGDDGTVRIWDWRTSTQTHLLYGHASWEEGGWHRIPVQLAYSADGRWLASSSDQVTIVWDTRAGTELRRLAGRGASFSPTGEQVATAIESALMIWELPSGKPTRELKHEPQNKILHTVWPDTHSLFAVDRNGNCKRWDLKSLTCKLFHVDNSSAELCAVSLFKKLIAVANYSGRVVILDAETGVPRGGPYVHADRAFCVAFSPDGRSVASVGHDEYVQIWDPVVPQVATFTDVPLQIGAAQARFINDKRLVYVGTDGHFRTLDLRRSGQFRHSERGPHAHNGIREFAYCKASSAIYARSGPGVVSWSVSGEALEQQWITALPGPSESLSTRHALTFLPEEPLLLISNATTLFFVEKHSGRIHRRISIASIDGEITSLRSSHRGNWLAIGTSTGSIGLYPRRAHGPFQSHRIASRAVTAMRFTPSDDRLIIAAEDGTISVWNPQLSSLEAVLSGSEGPVVDLAINPDGRTLASATDRAAVVRLWNISSGRQLCTLPTAPGFNVHDVTFFPDGNTLAACTAANQPKQGRIWLWRVNRP